MKSHLPGVSSRTVSLGGWSARVFGMAGTLLVHALMFQVGTLGMMSTKKRPPDETGPGSSAVVTGSAPELTLVLIHLPEVSESDPDPLEQLASVGVTDINASIQIVSPNPELAIDESLADASSEEVMTSGDLAARSVLFGRYTGQLSARIERAWRKPRSSVESMPSRTAGDAEDQSGDLFRCVARITQDPGGRVTEVELTRCNGSAVWQQSLVNAIQASSPLPAPADPTVFSRVLLMSFEGNEYRDGMSDRGYDSPSG